MSSYFLKKHAILTYISNPVKSVFWQFWLIHFFRNILSVGPKLCQINLEQRTFYENIFFAKFLCNIWSICKKRGMEIFFFFVKMTCPNISNSFRYIVYIAVKVFVLPLKQTIIMVLPSK